MERHTTTPKAITDKIIEFCNDILDGATPFYIPVAEAMNSKAGDCYRNVQKVVANKGGERILGWNIWIWTNILIEAEAHAVWKNTNGEYIDVTPHSDGEKQILFLPDTSLQYEGKLIKSIRQPLTSSQLVADFVEVTSKLEEIKRNSSGNTVELPGDLVQHYMWLLTVFNQKVGRNDPCPCQSGLKYKKCCGV